MGDKYTRSEAQTYETLCWSCQHAIRIRGEHECPWAWNFKPVPGWKAKKIIVNGVTETYRVDMCPMYKNDGTAQEKVNAEEESDELSPARKKKLERLEKEGKLPGIYQALYVRGGCRKCKWMRITKRTYNGISGICEYKNRNTRTSGGMKCIAFEKGEPHDD